MEMQGPLEQWVEMATAPQLPALQVRTAALVEMELMARMPQELPEPTVPPVPMAERVLLAEMVVLQAMLPQTAHQAGMALKGELEIWAKMALRAVAGSMASSVAMEELAAMVAAVITVEPDLVAMQVRTAPKALMATMEPVARTVLRVKTAERA